MKHIQTIEVFNEGATDYFKSDTVPKGKKPRTIARRLGNYFKDRKGDDRWENEKPGLGMSQSRSKDYVNWKDNQEDDAPEIEDIISKYDATFNPFDGDDTEVEDIIHKYDDDMYDDNYLCPECDGNDPNCEVCDGTGSIDKETYFDWQG